MVPTKVSHYEITERISAGKEEKLYENETVDE